MTFEIGANTVRSIEEGTFIQSQAKPIDTPLKNHRSIGISYEDQLTESVEDYEDGKILFTVALMPELPVKLLENLQSSNRTVKIPIQATSLPLKVVSSRLINDFLKDEGMVREDFYHKQKPKHVIIFSDNGVCENIEFHQIMQIIIAFDTEVSQMDLTSLCKKYCSSMKLDFPEKDDVNHITNLTFVTENLGVVSAKLESDMEIDKLFTIMKLNTAFLAANIGSNQNGSNGDLRHILNRGLVQGEDNAVNEQEEDAEDADDEEAADDDERDDEQVHIGPSIRVTVTYKLLVVGDGGVGKSTFLGRNLNGATYDVNMRGFEGVTITEMDFLTNFGRFRFECYKIFGQNPNESIMNNAVCAIIMFDVTNMQSFLHRRRWQSLLLRAHNAAGVPLARCGNIVLCGNKIDRVNDREVSPRMVANRVRHTMKYYEVGALANYNFEMPFLYLLRRLVDDNLNIVTEPVLAPLEVHVDLHAQQRNEAEYQTALPQL